MAKMQIEDLDRIAANTHLGRKIFENVPSGVRPCWGALLLDRLVGYIPSVTSVNELVQLIKTEEKWFQAHDQFSKIRRFRLDHPEFCPDTYLELAEKTAIITFNATNPAASFDRNSGWFIPKLVIQTSIALRIESLNNSVLITSLLMFESHEELRKELCSPDDFRFYRHIDDILWDDCWEPDGVVSRAGYQHFVVEMLRNCIAGANLETLAEYLCEAATSPMGVIRGRIETCRIIAQRILSEKNTCYNF